MYRCELCGQVIEPNTKAIRVPVETRHRQYPSRQKEISQGRNRKKTITVPGGTGFEIVREVVSCPTCAAKLRKQSQQQEQVSA
jgi:rubredoxin